MNKPASFWKIAKRLKETQRELELAHAQEADAARHEIATLRQKLESSEAAVESISRGFDFHKAKQEKQWAFIDKLRRRLKQSGLSSNELSQMLKELDEPH